MRRKRQGNYVEYTRAEDGTLIATERIKKAGRVIHRHNAYDVHSSWKRNQIQPPLTDDEREKADAILWRDNFPDEHITDETRLTVLIHLGLRKAEPKKI